MKYVLYLTIPIVVILCMISCKNSKPKAETGDNVAAFQEKYRPQFHFSPAEHWMNDPNGMVYYEGEYHLFYQHYPEASRYPRFPRS